jgi:hypothetical protein
MSRFFVGQRVRVVANSSPRHGCEARILGRSFSHHLRFGLGYYWDCNVDGWGERDSDGLGFAYADDQLEPIQPSGAAPSSYSYTELMDRLKAGEVECV